MCPPSTEKMFYKLKSKKSSYFRGRLLIAIKTEISDSIDTAPSEVEVEPTHPINEVFIYFSINLKK